MHFHARDSFRKPWIGAGRPFGAAGKLCGNPWTGAVALLLLLLFHLALTGPSLALVGSLGLTLCLTKRARKWCWDQPFFPALFGIIGALALIFLIEVYLGGSARLFGKFYPPGRQPILLEAPLIWALGLLYTLRPEQYLKFALFLFVLVEFIYFGAQKLSRSTKDNDQIKWREPAKKWLEILSGFTMVLGALVFANAVDLKTTGINEFAALYENESQKLGSNDSAIAELKKQIASLKNLNDALTGEQTNESVKPFLDATSDLIDQLCKVEKTKVYLGTYKQNEDPLPHWSVPLPPPPSPPPPTSISKKVLLHISNFLTLQRQAEAAERTAHELLESRDHELYDLTSSISAALASANILAPSEKKKLLSQIAQRIVALVANDDIWKATQEIRNLAEKEQQEARRQQQAKVAQIAAERKQKEARRQQRANVARVAAERKQQEALRQQQATAAQLSADLKRQKEFMRLQATLASLAAPFTKGVEKTNGGHCGGKSMGDIPERYTDHLEIVGQDGYLRPDAHGTHYHVKLTQNDRGESLPNGGFWIDIPDDLTVSVVQMKRVCTGDNECRIPPFNIIWTDESYPTQDNPNLRPVVYCYWPKPLLD